MTTISRVILGEQSALSESLSPNQAARFSVNGEIYYCFDQPAKHHIEAARRAIVAGKSAGIITGESQSPEAIFFDMDGTVIEEESLVEIAKSLKKEDEIHRLTELAMTGAMDFKTSLQARLKILKGLSRSQVLEIKPTLCAGILQFASWCHQQKIKIFLISGGFQELAAPVAKQLGCVEFLANRFSWDGDIMQGGIDGDIIDGEGKQRAVANWIKTFGFQTSRTVAVGDGANDILMMKTSGLAVGFKPKPILWPDLQIANHTGDHRFLLESLHFSTTSKKS
jgi:phosphoserine phosphatase